MGVALHFLGDHENHLTFSTSVFEAYPSLQHQKTNSLRIYLLYCQAYAYLCLGQPASAERICRHTEQVFKTYSVDFVGGKYLENTHKILCAEVYFSENEYNKAIRTAENAVENAQKLDFKILALMNFSLLNKIYQQLDMSKQQNDTLQQIELIRKSTSFKQVVSNFAR